MLLINNSPLKHKEVQMINLKVTLSGLFFKYSGYCRSPEKDGLHKIAFRGIKNIATKG